MKPTSVVLAVQVGWLVLCGMMLFSRFLFQAAGPLRMRAFLDAWKLSFTHQAWGALAITYGVAVLVGTVATWGALTWVDRGLALLLVGILCGDGLLNLLPSWFGHFKERMQDARVKRHRGTEKAGDKHLFGMVNILLGAASLLVAVLVYSYRPLPVFWLAASAAIALVLMTAFIAGCQLERQRASEHIG